MLGKLNFPEFEFSFRKHSGNIEIFDSIRKKYVKNTPEEWVRQHLLRYLVEEKNYPASLIAVEFSLQYNGLKKRCDALVFNAEAQPLVLIECKAPHIPINQKVLEQIARYNFSLNVPYLVISNGMKHYMVSCNSSPSGKNIHLIKEIPTFDAL